MATWRDLTTAQDELHRPASIVSLLLDTAPEVPVHVGSISDDQRFCAAGCDRDVRTTAGRRGLRDLSMKSLQSWLKSWLWHALAILLPNF